MLELQQIDLQYAQHHLFKEASFALYPGQKYGLIGRNGTGKTSLLNLIKGLETPDGGNIVASGQPLIASIEQEIEQLNLRAIDYVIQGYPEIGDLWLKMKELENDEAYEALADVHMQLAEKQAYDIEATAGKILMGLGFSEEEYLQPVRAFSGGWRVRLNLARCLIQPADILLLDEPTNHLDMDAIIWLEDWLQQFQGSLILIAHDRYFLDQVVDHILAIENQQLVTYKGNYSQYEHARYLRIEQAEKQREKQEKERERVQKFVDRFRATATKAKQVQSRVKYLEKMPEIEQIQQESPYRIEFLSSPSLSNPVIKIKDVDFAYGEHQVLENVQFDLQVNDRVGLLGLNGAGKSTFVKLLADALQPDTGERHYCKKVQIGYFAQHQVENLYLEQHALWHFKQIAPDQTEKTLRTYLGRYNFSGDKVFQSVGSFSGGEKARLALALIIWQRPNLLLLDEPTNHLDMAMREALTYALQSYEGVLVLISHDRHLLEACVNQFYLVNNQQVRPFEGDLQDYAQWSRQQRQVEEIKAKEPNNSSKQKTDQKQLKAIERDLDKEQKALEAIDQQLLQTQADDYQKQQELGQKRAQIQQKIDELEEAWLIKHE